MPKLSDAINKVKQEEAHRKKPIKRRPYLDNISPIIPVENVPVVKPKAPIVLKTEPVEEILKSQPNIIEKTIPDREVGEDTTQFLQDGRNWDAPATHRGPEPEAKASTPVPIKETIVAIPTFILEEEIPKTKSQPGNEKKLKPIINFLDSEFDLPVVPKPTTKIINNSPSTVNPKGTMGTDEEDGVDLSLYNIEQFGHTTKTVLFYIFRKAKENKCLVTPPLKKNDLQKECGINFNTIKSVLQRLSHYKFIKLEKFQRGPFGWTRYSIRESLYNQLLYNFDGQIPTHRPEKLGTNFTENNSFEIGEEITLADSLKEIGFNMGHVRQLQKMPMAADKIQNSLDAFAFDMQDKEFKLKIRSPLAVFMKVAKTEGEYISSRGYVSPEDEILQQMITLKKDRALQIKKQQDELLNLSFNEWLGTKTKDEINKIAPPSGDYLGPLHKATLKNWYQENVFEAKSQ